jgi:hypothetical protein
MIGCRTGDRDRPGGDAPAFLGPGKPLRGKVLGSAQPTGKAILRVDLKDLLRVDGSERLVRAWCRTPPSAKSATPFIPRNAPFPKAILPFSLNHPWSDAGVANGGCRRYPIVGARALSQTTVATIGGTYYTIL